MLNRMGDSAASIGFDTGDRRAAVLRAEQERIEERRSRIDALTSPFATPHERIRLWEDLHGLRLPRTADHMLVRVIASRTALSVQQIHDEQQRRVEGSPL
jgi:hypothetical protein